MTWGHPSLCEDSAIIATHQSLTSQARQTEEVPTFCFGVGAFPPVAAGLLDVLPAELPRRLTGFLAPPDDGVAGCLSELRNFRKPGVIGASPVVGTNTMVSKCLICNSVGKILYSCKN